MKFIGPFKDDLASVVLGFHLEQQQSEFVAQMPEILDSLSNRISGHVIYCEQNPAGFFIIDKEYSSEYAFADKNSVGLRSLLISLEFQGRGLAKRSLLSLPNYLRSLNITPDSIFLTVNCRNIVAANLYRKFGFLDTGDIYHGGPKGPQHIMRMPVT